jgi:hypothetical protein
MLPFHPQRCGGSKRYLILEAAVVSILGISTFWFYKCVQSYGWNGTFRYLWVGDVLPPEIRQLVDILQTVSQSLDTIDAVISNLEKAFEQARLDTMGGTSPANIFHRWRTNLHCEQHDLRKTLAKVSFDLDMMASKIDQIPSKEEVRLQKKELSNRTVLLMARVDRLIEFFTTATMH